MGTCLLSNFDLFSTRYVMNFMNICFISFFWVGGMLRCPSACIYWTCMAHQMPTVVVIRG